MRKRKFQKIAISIQILQFLLQILFIFSAKTIIRTTITTNRNNTDDSEHRCFGKGPIHHTDTDN